MVGSVALNFGGRPRPAWRRPAWWAVLVLVVLAHAGVVRQAGQWLAPVGSGESEPPRMQAVYTRRIELQAPPAVAPRAAAPAPRGQQRAAARVPARAAPASAAEVAQAASAQAASAPAGPDAPRDEEGASAATAEEHATAHVPGETPGGGETQAQAQVPETATGAAQSPGAAAAGAPAFEWPVSTRLSYTMQGYYRGEVRGSAQVEWLREGSRYEVHVEVIVGPRAASLMGRRMSSRGELTAAGLVPRRYDEDTRLGFAHRHAIIEFGAGRARLASGRDVEAPPGVQDAASQFVQLTYRLTVEPQLLQVGRVIDFPLALPKRLDRWYYEVVALETLTTPLGPVEAYHLVPRRELPTRDALLAEMWFAPQLQYLPVRIRIRQDADTYIDLLIDRLPEQAAGAPAPTPPSGKRP